MARATPAVPTLGERDAATYLGFSGHYLRVARASGRGPAYIRVGRSIRYRVRDLDAWQEAHLIDPSEPSRPHDAVVP